MTEDEKKKIMGDISIDLTVKYLNLISMDASKLHKENNDLNGADIANIVRNSICTLLVSIVIQCIHVDSKKYIAKKELKDLIDYVWDGVEEANEKVKNEL